MTNPTQAPTKPLSNYTAGETVVVARVSDRETDELEYLARAGIVPGKTLTISEVAPIGMYVVEHEDGTVHLPESIAEATEVYDGTNSAEGAFRW